MVNKFHTSKFDKRAGNNKEQFRKGANAYVQFENKKLEVVK